MNREKILKLIVQKLVQNDACNISVFGSFAREEETLESDIDIIVKFSTIKSLLELVRIERELMELIGRKIDLLTEKSISPYLIDSIKEEMVTIYG